MKIAIISNGLMFDYEKMKRIISDGYDYTICADGGANHTYKMGLTPQLIVGDMDSIEEEVVDFYKKQNVAFKTYEMRKDDTDTTIAIKQAIMLAPKTIGLFGSSGKRLDHTLANIGSLFFIKSNGIAGKIIDEYSEVQIAEEKTGVKGNKGDTVSLISLSEWTKGVTLEGLEYPLTNYDIHRDHQIGVSNVMTGSHCFITKKSGDLLVIKSYE